jgi:hypothetical protein
LFDLTRVDVWTPGMRLAGDVAYVFIAAYVFNAPEWNARFFFMDK